MFDVLRDTDRPKILWLSELDEKLEDKINRLGDLERSLDELQQKVEILESVAKGWDGQELRLKELESFVKTIRKKGT